MIKRPAFFATLTAEQVDEIEELIDEAAEDGYQNGYEAGLEEASYMFSPGNPSEYYD